MSICHEEPFTQADLKSSILRVVSVAHTQGLIDACDVFCLGMTQHDQEDWEDGDYVVQHIDYLLGMPQASALPFESRKKNRSRNG